MSDVTPAPSTHGYCPQCSSVTPGLIGLTQTESVFLPGAGCAACGWQAPRQVVATTPDRRGLTYEFELHDNTWITCDSYLRDGSHDVRVLTLGLQDDMYDYHAEKFGVNAHVVYAAYVSLQSAVSN